MKIQSAWHFFFFPCWSDFETPRDPSWTETGVLQHFLLAHSISSSKCGFLCVWWGSSSMWIFSQVLFWFCLFPLRPFCQRLDNGCNHFRLRYKHSWFTARREWGAGRQRSCRQSAGSLDRSSVPSVQLVREWLGGSSRRGGMKWWENWGLQAVKFSSNTWIMFIRGCKHDIFLHITEHDGNVHLARPHAVLLLDTFCLILEPLCFGIISFPQVTDYALCSGKNSVSDSWQGYSNKLLSLLL